jgi:hypothetical protein
MFAFAPPVQTAGGAPETNAQNKKPGAMFEPFDFILCSPSDDLFLHIYY